MYKILVQLLSMVFVSSWVDKFEEEVFYRNYAETMLFWHERAKATGKTFTGMGITHFVEMEQPLSWWRWCIWNSYLEAMRWWKREGRWAYSEKPIIHITAMNAETSFEDVLQRGHEANIWELEPAYIGETLDPLYWIAQGEDPYAGLRGTDWDPESRGPSD